MPKKNESIKKKWIIPKLTQHHLPLDFQKAVAGLEMCQPYGAYCASDTRAICPV